MAVVLTDNFNDGSFSQWTIAAPFPTAKAWGCGGTLCFLGCTNASIFHDAGANSATGTVRFSCAVLDTGDFVGTPRQMGIFTAVDKNTVFPFQGVVFDLELINDVAHRNTVAVFSTGGNVYSAPFVYPDDGTWFGVEAAWSVSGAVTTFSIYINGTLVLGSSVTRTNPFSSVWNRVFLVAYRHPTPVNDPADLMTAFENVVLDDTVQYTNYHPCTAPTISPLGCVDAPPITITGLTVDCALLRLTIAGGFFADEFSVDLQNSLGPVPFMIVSQSATAVVLQLNAPFLADTYCATITNFVSGAVSNQFCTALACVPPPPPGCVPGGPAAVTGDAGCVVNFPTG